MKVGFIRKAEFSYILYRPYRVQTSMQIPLTFFVAVVDETREFFRSFDVHVNEIEVHKTNKHIFRKLEKVWKVNQQSFKKILRVMS